MGNSTETYFEMQCRQQKEYNAFADRCTFAAYDSQQFNEGMARLGLDPEKDLDKLCQITVGVFLLKDHEKDFYALGKRFAAEQQGAIDADTTGEGFIYEMFLYELGNHEYGYTGDLADTLDALGLNIGDVNASPRLKHGLNLAISKVLEEET